jgi:hypothetical protein
MRVCSCFRCITFDLISNERKQQEINYLEMNEKEVHKPQLVGVLSLHY